MNTILRQNSKDRHIADYFPVGQVVLQNDFEFDRLLQNPIEAQGAVDCTTIDLTDICTNQTGQLYDEQDLWAKVPNKSPLGVDPRDTLNTLISSGLQPVSGDQRDKRWTSYLRAEGNSGDYFENARASMLATKSPMMTNTNYYLEWLNTDNNGVVPQGVTRLSGHSYEITGCRLAPEGLQFHMKDWTGKKKWMPKEVFNTELHKYGTSAWIPTTKETTANQISFVQWCIDVIINLLLKLKNQ